MPSFVIVQGDAGSCVSLRVGAENLFNTYPRLGHVLAPRLRLLAQRPLRHQCRRNSRAARRHPDAGHRIENACCAGHRSGGGIRFIRISRHKITKHDWLASSYQYPRLAGGAMLEARPVLHHGSAAARRRPLFAAAGGGDLQGSRLSAPIFHVAGVSRVSPLRCGRAMLLPGWDFAIDYNPCWLIAQVMACPAKGSASAPSPRISGDAARPGVVG